MKAIVNVHAAQTTTSKAETRFGIMTCSKRKLITSETETATNDLRLHVQLQLSKLSQPTTLGLDVTGNTLTTMLTQLQPEKTSQRW
jgi:hypothetical protein